MTHRFFRKTTKVGISFLFGVCCATAVQAANIQQLYLVRHAEKADNGKDPLLSACGQAQAAALATLLQQVQLPMLYHSGYQRTQQTAADRSRPQQPA